MIFEVDASKLATMMTNEVNNALCFQKNVQNFMEDFKDAEDEEYMVQLAKGIAYNKRHITLHLHRAAILLQLVGEFDGADDELDVNTIGAKVTAWKQRFEIKDGE